MTAKAARTSAPSGTPRQHGIRRAAAPHGADNQAVQALFRRGVVRAKLEVGRIDDPEEHAADAMADRVMRSADSSCCPACAGGGSCGEEAVRRAPAHSGSASAPAGGAAGARAGLAGGGTPLPTHLRGFFEPRFGRDLGQVRLHTNPAAAASARALGARAYALGPNIAFAAGRYQPDSTAGRHLLAHELAHVVRGGQAPALRRQTEGEDHIAQLRGHLAADHEQDAIAAARALTPDEVTRVLADLSLRILAVDAFNDAEMGDAMLAMHGDAVSSLRWLFAEGCTWKQIGPFLRSTPPGLAAVLPDNATRDGFVEALDDEEMADALLLLPGPLAQKIEWLRAEDTTYTEVQKVVEATPAAERPALYGRDDLLPWFVDICDDTTMENLVLLLGGTLQQKLGWMKAEGSSWMLLHFVLDNAPQVERTALYSDPEMKAFFVESLDDDEMKQAVDLMGGTLSQQMEWLQAEGSDVAPTAVELPPALSERDVTLLNQLEAHTQLLVRYQEWEAARDAVRIMQLVGGSSPYASMGLLAAQAVSVASGRKDPVQEALEREKTARAALVAELQAQGFTTLQGFVDEILRFEAFFLGFGLQMAFAMLNDNQQIANKEHGRYSGSEGVELMALLQEKLMQNAYDQLALIYNDFNKVAMLPSQKGQFPILAHPAFYSPGLRDILIAKDAAALSAHVDAVVDGVLENIDETRGKLRGDTSKLWQLDGVIEQAKQVMGIANGSVFDMLIKRKLDEIAREERFRAIAIAALAIGLGLLSGGTGALAVLGAAGALTLSVVGAAQSWSRYTFTAAAHGSAIDPARALTQVDPSAAWLALDVIGVFLDLGGFASAINNLRKPAEAMLKAGEAAAGAAGRSGLEHSANDVASGLVVGRDIVSKEAFVASVMESAERRAAQEAALAHDPALASFVRSQAGALAHDDAAVAGLVSLGRGTAETALKAFGDNPQLLGRLALLAETEPAFGNAIARLHGSLGDEAFAHVLSDVLLRRDPGRANALVAAMANERLTAEQLERLAAAGRQADPAARSSAIAAELDRTLQEATGLAAPGSAAEARALETTRALDKTRISNPADQLEAEWNYVQGARPVPINEGDYVAEVVLPNGHRWRQNRGGGWCRFSDEFCLTDLDLEALAAKNPALVWVNTRSGVFHPEGSQWFGATKEGKLMPADEASDLFRQAGAAPQPMRPVHIGGVQVESAGAAPRGGKFIAARARDPRALTTAISAEHGEALAYHHVLSSGEFGLRRPIGANVPGSDFISAEVVAGAQPGALRARIYVNDVKMSGIPNFPAPATTIKPTWRAELMDVVKQGRLDLGNPALEQAIREATDLNTWEVYIRQINVDFSTTFAGAPDARVVIGQAFRVAP